MGPCACFVVASGGVLSEGYGHDGPTVRLGDGQTVAEGVSRDLDTTHINDSLLQSSNDSRN